jgi:hypothetical protein
LAASITHLVVGECILYRNFSDAELEVQAAFLAGCAVVDIHAFSDVQRQQTHFVGTGEENGEDACSQSCVNFFRGLGSLLQHPAGELQPGERGFVAGYLCHLAVDECWKKLGWRLFQKFGISSWDEFVVPGDVSLTTFDFLSARQILDPQVFDALLGQVVISDVFTHVPAVMFNRQWEIIREYVMARGTPEAHFQMLRRAGRSDEEIHETRQRYQTYWESSIQLVHSIGGVEPFLQAGLERSMEVLAQLEVFFSINSPARTLSRSRPDFGGIL